MIKNVTSVKKGYTRRITMALFIYMYLSSMYEGDISIGQMVRVSRARDQKQAHTGIR